MTRRFPYPDENCESKVARRMTRTRHIIPIGLLLFAGFIPGIAMSAAEEDALPWEEARRFVEALETIRTQYAEPVEDAVLIDEAIRGMAAGLDPYSVYLDPAEYEQARIDALGSYEGIGVEVSRVEGGYVIVAPIDGGPAERAGLLAGDLLLGVNDEPLDGVDPAALDALLHGDAGGAVRLTVQRGDAVPFEVTLVREVINIRSISGEKLGNGIAYLRIAQFNDTSAHDLADLLDDMGMENGDASGLIVDLRNNVGGIVDGAVAIADAFLDGGVIVSTRGRAQGQTFEYAAQPGDLAAHLPIVVLVNRGTASAAEILAGALQDHQRGTVLGTTTFGKGAVQSLIPLEGGGALKLTTAYYTTPSGRIIQDAGIVPDVEAAEADAAMAEKPRDDVVVRRASDLLAARHGGKHRQ
jgi:carboxyl-terminal processing protease